MKFNTEENSEESLGGHAHLQPGLATVGALPALAVGHQEAGGDGQLLQRGRQELHHAAVGVGVESLRAGQAGVEAGEEVERVLGRVVPRLPADPPDLGSEGGLGGGKLHTLDSQCKRSVNLQRPGIRLQRSYSQCYLSLPQHKHGAVGKAG